LFIGSREPCAVTAGSQPINAIQKSLGYSWFPLDAKTNVVYFKILLAFSILFSSLLLLGSSNRRFSIILNFIVSNREIYINDRRSASAQMAKLGINSIQFDSIQFNKTLLKQGN
jgi:hypothetical protein